MNLIQRLFGRASRIQDPDTQPPFSVSRRDAGRRELLTMAVRDTLRKHGIPVAWIQAEASPVLTRDALNLRLIARHWNPALASCVVALQKSVVAHLERLDPRSSEWLASISWKFEPVDDTLCPALPSADYWQDFIPRPAAPRVREVRAPAVSEGLRRLLAEGDRAFAGQAVDGFSPTRPMVHG